MGSIGAGNGSRTIKPIFRKNTANELERLYNQQTLVVRDIQILRRGLPIAVSKAKTELEKLQIRKRYNAEIADKEIRANNLSKQIEDVILNAK